MKSVLFLALTLSATLSFATSQGSVNQKALEILLKQSSKLSTIEGKTVANILASELMTSETTHNKISNTCTFDKNDQLFNCELRILNQDDNGGSESSTTIKYQLQRKSSGAPSDVLFKVSVEVERAG